jgi:hypothetical protein
MHEAAGSETKLSSRILIQGESKSWPARRWEDDKELARDAVPNLLNEDFLL